jgi:alpha-glucosidase
MQAQVYAYMNAIPEGGWPDWLIGGHDKPRIASRIGQQQARVAAMLLLTMKGTAFFFQGDELAMERGVIGPGEVEDIFEKRVSGYGLNRDPERTPMRWDPSEKAGFTKGEPWLPIGKDIETRNVESMRKDKRSILWLYKKLIALRKEEPALQAGEYVPLRSANDVFMYRREHGQDKLLVALNLKDEPRRIDFGQAGRVLLSTYLDGKDEPVDGAHLLRANEGIVVKL